MNTTMEPLHAPSVPSCYRFLENTPQCLDPFFDGEVESLSLSCAARSVRTLSIESAERLRDSFLLNVIMLLTSMFSVMD